jgi:uncharacterized RDD family membrane protein YckC
MEQILDTTQIETKPAPYAGFWIRVGAYFIDAILLGVIQLLIMYAMIGGVLFRMRPGEIPDSSLMARLFSMYGIVIVIRWLYFAGMESSANQATVGKMAVGIKVTDLNGNRISFANATGRFFSKIISGVILFIGYLMIAFTAKKQGLHDQIAGTFVVKK